MIDAEGVQFFLYIPVLISTLTVILSIVQKICSPSGCTDIHFDWLSFRRVNYIVVFEISSNHMAVREGAADAAFLDFFLGSRK